MYIKGSSNDELLLEKHEIKIFRILNDIKYEILKQNSENEEITPNGILSPFSSKILFFKPQLIRNNLVYSKYSVALNYLNEGRWYLCAYPHTDYSMRVLVYEFSGRRFNSKTKLKKCSPPPKNDFVEFKIKSMGFDLNKKAPSLTIPVVSSLYIPNSFGKMEFLSDYDFEHEI